MEPEPVTRIEDIELIREFLLGKDNFEWKYRRLQQTIKIGTFS